MQFFLSFLEGVITFISPCLLPMLPVYVSYFAGGRERKTAKTLINALGFVLGFTLVFLTLGALAGTVGAFLKKYSVAVNIVTGLIVVFFGLNYLGVFKLNIFSGSGARTDTRDMNFFTSLLFGIVFSVGWTPCVGPFLGSALMLASQQNSIAVGIVLLTVYSAGLGIPFIISALLIDKLKATFDFIKRNYRVINAVSGGVLIVIGLLMMTGMLNQIITILS